LGLELVLVLLDERADFLRHPEQLRPLLLVQGHGKAAEAVDGHAALLADFDAAALGGARLQLFVLGAETLDFGFEIVVGHPAIVARGPVAGTWTAAARRARRAAAASKIAGVSRRANHRHRSAAVLGNRRVVCTVRRACLTAGSRRGGDVPRP